MLLRPCCLPPLLDPGMARYAAADLRLTVPGLPTEGAFSDPDSTDRHVTGKSGPPPAKEILGAYSPHIRRMQLQAQGRQGCRLDGHRGITEGAMRRFMKPYDFYLLKGGDRCLQNRGSQEVRRARLVEMVYSHRDKRNLKIQNQIFQKSKSKNATTSQKLSPNRRGMRFVSCGRCIARRRFVSIYTQALSTRTSSYPWPSQLPGDLPPKCLTVHRDARPIRRDTSRHRISRIMKQTRGPTNPDRNPIVRTHFGHRAPDESGHVGAPKLEF